MLDKVLIFENVLYAMIVNIRVAIKSINANFGILNLKNIVVQHKLNANWIKNIVNDEQYG